MKVAIPGASVVWILQWTRYVLVAAAVAMLGYSGFVLANGWMFQRRETRQLELSASPEQVQFENASPAAATPAIAADGLIGRIAIPRLGISVIVMEGVGTRTLRRAVGHIPGTALPGQPGNIGIAGHRDTYFSPLKNIRRDDIITVTTKTRVYQYLVVSIKVVSPTDVAVLKPNGTEVLTLVTCFPFYFVGPAPDRFIVRAERVI